MKIVKPSYEIMYYNPDTIKLLEKAGRTCYKSEDKITDESADKFIKMLIDRGHEAMIEHSVITVKFISNRGFTHELVRMRLASYAQESTRYCNYSKDKFGNEITVIEPYWFHDSSSESKGQWTAFIKFSEASYFKLLENGIQAQGARGVLPIDIKTEIIITANIREWRHIFKLRCAKAAHPDMRRLMIPLLNNVSKMFPVLFDDVLFGIDDE